LIRLDPKLKASDEFLQLFSRHFKNNSTLFAIDFYNEPLYFDKIGRKKREVFDIVNRWQNIVKKSNHHTLTTIGLVGVREVFEWDPNILNVDFISFHPYNHEPNQVLNEIYWYGKYVNKPWIIGETAIPADNDSITYDEQKTFALQTINQTYNCGGLGYSWWQFKDVDWKNYHANFMGILNTKGQTFVSDADISVDGTPKPLIKVIQSFDSRKKKKPCVCLNNYYNYSQSKPCKIVGFLVDKKNNKPIQGGVVMAWNKNWTESHHTITKANGEFTLLCDFQPYHWVASATKYVHIEAGFKDKNQFVYYLDTLKIDPLQFLSNPPYVVNNQIDEK